MLRVRDLREILEEYDGEMEVVIAEYGNPNEVYEIEKVMLNVRKDEPRLALIPEY